MLFLYKKPIQLSHCGGVKCKFKHCNNELCIYIRKLVQWRSTINTDKIKINDPGPIGVLRHVSNTVLVLSFTNMILM